MGVASCGKTTVGEALARELGVAFIEGDRLHSAENVAKMSSGIPLTDDDRWPWLAKVGAALQGSEGHIAILLGAEEVLSPGHCEGRWQAGKVHSSAWRQASSRSPHLVAPGSLHAGLASRQPAGDIADADD